MLSKYVLIVVENGYTVKVCDATGAAIVTEAGSILIISLYAVLWYCCYRGLLIEQKFRRLH